MIPSWLPAMTMVSGTLVGVGYAVGKLHIRRLAFAGGESRYPQLVQKAVSAYRTENLVGELQEHDNR